MFRLLGWGSVLGMLCAGFFLGAGQAQDSSTPAPTGPVATMSPAPWQPEEPLRIRVNIPGTRLDLYVDDQWVKSYPVAIGTRRYPTPVRDYSISMIIWNPWWVPPESEWAQDAEKTPPGPGNPLGAVKLILEGPMRIHGTNQPRSIGRAVSHACLRMHNADAQELAWEIQKRYSEKTDPKLLKKYKKNRRRTYYVRLLGEVPVGMDYRQVERKPDRLLLHPNRYGRAGFQEELQEALRDQPQWILDRDLVKRLHRLRRQRTVEVLLKQIRAWATGQSLPLNPEARKALSVH